MRNFLKHAGLKISLIAVIIATPSIMLASSGSGFAEGSSESISAGLENPTFEGQLARINIGINLVRLNTDIMRRMPISEDAEWVDKIIQNMTSKMYRQTLKTKAVREDAYYSTVTLTNIILQRPAIAVSPLSARLYFEASVIYKNDSNGYKGEGFHVPDMNEFPDISSIKSFVTFKDDEKVAVINVEARNGTLYKNMIDATISLVPEDLQEEIKSAYKEFQDAKKELGLRTSIRGSLEAWLDDDKNSGSPETENKESQLTISEAVEEEKEKIVDEKEEAYFLLLQSGALAIEGNFDENKVPLAKKLEALLDTVDNNAISAQSMFGSATIGLIQGYGAVEDEMKAIAAAQALTYLVGDQKQFLVQRYERMLMGGIMAVPNIAVGVGVSGFQICEIGKYQDIVEKVLEGAEAAEEEQAQGTQSND